MATEKKDCRWCGRSLPTADYHKAGDTLDGLQAICKTCNKFRTMFKFYGTKDKKELVSMIEERKVRILLMEMKMNEITPRDAVAIATLSLFQK